MKTKTKVLIAKMLSSAILAVRGGRDRSVEATRRGIRYRLDLKEGIDLAIYLGVYENSTVRAYRKLIRRGDWVLDIGANIGAHTLQFADLVGDGGRVIAFEPTDFAFSKLMTNIGLNPSLSGRIVANQLMLVDSDATPRDSLTKLYSSWPLTAEKELHPDHQGRQMTTTGARSTTLDAYCRSSATPRVDVIKMDVDGYEIDVLRGARSMMRQYHPVFIMELCPYLLEERGFGVEEILEIFRSQDYGMRDIVNGALLPADPRGIHDLIPRGSSVNVIASKTARS